MLLHDRPYSASYADSVFRIVGSGDATKKLAFEVDAQTTAVTTTINTGAQTASYSATLPVMTAARTFAMLEQIQTFTAAQTFTGNITQTGATMLSTGTGVGTYNHSAANFTNKLNVNASDTATSLVSIGTTTTGLTTGATQRGMRIFTEFGADASALMTSLALTVRSVAGASTPTTMVALNVEAPVLGGAVPVTLAGVRITQPTGASGADVGLILGSGVPVAGAWALYGTTSQPSFFGTGTALFGNSTTVNYHDDGSGSASPDLQVQTTGQDASIGVSRWSATGSAAPAIILGKSLGTSVGTFTVVASGNSLGRIDWNGADGTDFATAASIRVTVDGTPGSDDMPGKMWFATTADGAGTTTDRLSIDALGQVAVLATTDATSTTTGSLTTLGGVSWGATKSAFGGLLDLSGAFTTTGNITQTGATTLSTGTGGVTLNGDITAPVRAVFGSGALSTSFCVLVRENAGVTGTTNIAYGTSSYSFAATATASGEGFRASLTTVNSAFTMPYMAGFRSGAHSKGASATVTRVYGFVSLSQTIGGTANVGYLHGSTTAPTGTYAWYNSTAEAEYHGTGQSSWGDTTDATSTTTGSLTTLGGMSFGVTKSLFGGGFKSTSATLGIGYATGAGGAVTQITSRTTGVTLNTVCGAITLVSAAGSATYQSFTVTNSTVAATDTIICNQKSGTDLNLIAITAVAAGSFRISFATTGGTTSEQPVFNFSVIKAVAA